MGIRACGAGALLGLLASVAVGAGAAGGGLSWPAEAERIASKLGFTEGPAWHPEGFLVFSDIRANRIYQWQAGKGLRVFREPSHRSNGLLFDTRGRLLACEHGTRRVTRAERDGSTTVLADRYLGKRLNSPNDLALHSTGAIYFTDPPYGVKAADRELDFQGVYRIAPDGKLTLLIREMLRPNGIVLSPDEKRLYVGDSAKRIVNAHEVEPDGALGPARLHFDLGKHGSRVVDGMAIDVAGNLYATATAAVFVISPRGRLLASIRCPGGNTTNCCFGDPDRRTLFITAGPNVFRARCPIEGYGVKGP